MAYTLFIIYILALSTGLGLGLFGAFLEGRAVKHGIRSKARVRALILTKTGVAFQSAILLWAIIPHGTVDPSPASFAFLTGMLIALVGLAGLSATTIKEVAEAEAKADRRKAEGGFQEAEAGRIDAEVGRAAGEEYRERGEEYRETGEKRREEGEKK